ncbi:uncharacterized protein [Drosophila takahashii]|uniref:uncharacterized protein n=1 Tax=Drosophila takahashii TaxID=29030 RepID=UPI001CF7F7CC|nr:uncharacterized protein LOC123002515 [Drosophila takahashii]
MKFYNDCRESYDKYRAIIRDGMEQSTSQAEVIPDPTGNPASIQHPTIGFQKLISACRRQKAILDSIRRTLKEYSGTGKSVTSDLIKSLWAQTQEIHFSVHEEYDDPSKGGYDMKSFLKLEKEIQDILGAKSNSSSNEDMHLPRVSIPKLDGDLLKWTQFFDLFKCMVHDTNMPTVRKMWYLKTTVTGEAERLIRHIDLKEENYLSAWGILVDSYNNPRHVADTILNRFLHQNTVSDDPRSLKELYITTIESLASLKGLGIDVSSWDTILIAIIKQKLDLASRALYEQSLDGSRELQGLDTLLSFLDQRIRVLGTGKKGQQSRKEQKGTTCSSASTGKGPCCQFCKRNHWLYKCDDFRSKTIPERVNWLQKQRLCVNCFSNDHKAKDCRGRPCFKCDKKHHTLLHLENTSGASSNQHSPTVGAASNKNYNLLATVKVSVKASNGQVATFRALLDSGSQINLISERMASVLSLKLHGTSLRIEGIGGNPKTSRARANVQIKSMHNAFTQEVEAFVLPHIIADQPAHQLNSASLQIPSNIALADPNFDKPGVKAKIFMQTLWALNLSWDDELPQELQNDWKNYRSDLQALNSMQIPRHIYNGKVPVHQEVHTFVDASERAYGAAVYIRAPYKNNQISVRLLCSKSRVAPSAKETLPRLELCPALLGAELTHRVRKDLRLPIEKASGYFWTDSTVALSWINASSAAYHTFVSNRIAKIQAVSDPSQWRHVSSANNPADVLLRGIEASKLSEHTLWLYGPLFLHGSSDKWVKRPIIGLSDLERRTKQVSLPACQGQTGEELYNCKHSNSFRKLQRIVAYMMRFCYKRNRSSTTTLCIGELTHARTIILRTIQKIDFACEYKQLVAHKAVDKKSALVSLFPMTGKDSLIRVGGRLEESKLTYNAKHQILLPYNDPIVRMLLREMHEENMHCGAQALRAIARQQYWIINDKTMARSIIHCCVKCTKARPKLMQQIMGNLPVDRVTQARPFFNSGVDYCEPICIHHKLRGKRPDKAYIAVFCCFATKAVHLELVSDLTTDAFLGALRRFLSRRGRCQTIHCDNATNFVGANNKLKALEEAIFTDKAQAQIIHHCNQRQVDFKFIPPRAPSFGGLWEAAVKSAKRLLVSVTATASLTFEELNTVIVEVEAILNSRPITPMSFDPTDASALTPGHFLIGEPLTAPPDVNLSPTNKTLVKRWELVSRLKHAFWKQWSMEYLQELQTRNKWKTMSQNVKEGLLVLIKEDRSNSFRRDPKKEEIGQPTCTNQENDEQPSPEPTPRSLRSALAMVEHLFNGRENVQSQQ